MSNGRQVSHLKHESVKTRLKHLTQQSTLDSSAKNRIRKKLDLEFERLSNEHVKTRRVSVTQRLVTGLSIVAPVVIMVVGYRLWSDGRIDAGRAAEPGQKVTVPAEVVTPTVMPTNVSTVPSVTLDYTNHSDYEYTLNYTDSSGTTRFMIQEGTAPPKNVAASPEITWTVQDIAVQVFQPNPSNTTAQFTYKGRSYTVEAIGSTTTALKQVTTSLVSGVLKRG